ncbi:YIP1 family protein [Clostridium sp. OS1-26]|uniref:YIP1 family protein n=1 Tax=Clostridium sp. OS1-26 TaxID=3070681 RepID=UPI0027E01640|nr:YIP1 family protein [Clostridium sp. OS1-26]WML34861.1 YIP1 family protein [Clostridium sp. OS1-26]
MSKEGIGGVFKNIIGVIVEPKAVLQRVSDNPKILKYLIPITLVQLIISIIELPKLVNFTILKAHETQNLPDNVIPILRKTVTASVIITSIFSPIVIAVIITALIKLVTMFIEENANFKQLLAVNILAYIPMLIGGIVGAIVIMFTEPQNIKNVTTSLAIFLSSTVSETSRIYKLLASIDMFVIWSAILISIGTSIAYKMNIKKSSFIVFGLYVVSIVIRVLV